MRKAYSPQACSLSGKFLIASLMVVAMKSTLWVLRDFGSCCCRSLSSCCSLGRTNSSRQSSSCLMSALTSPTDSTDMFRHLARSLASRSFMSAKNRVLWCLHAANQDSSGVTRLQ